MQTTTHMMADSNIVRVTKGTVTITMMRVVVRTGDGVGSMERNRRDEREVREL